MTDQTGSAMTPERYAQMKRSEADRAGHPIARLRCQTIQTSRDGDGRLSASAHIGPAMRWFWFDGDTLLSRDSVSGDGVCPERLSSIADFLSTAVSATTTAVLAERGDLDRVLASSAEASLYAPYDDIRMWAELPISRHVVILTESLALRYWAQSGMDTSAFDDWVIAFGGHSLYGKGGDINGLISHCRMLGYPPDDAAKYSLVAPTAFISSVEYALDQTHPTGATRFLRIEQLLKRWSNIERFDPLNIEQALCSGEVCRFESPDCIGADVAPMFAVGDLCQLLDHKRFEQAEAVITAMDYVERDGRQVVLVGTAPLYTPPPTEFRPTFIARYEDLECVGTMTRVLRWRSSGIALYSPLTHEAPVDVILAGRAT